MGLLANLRQLAGFREAGYAETKGKAFGVTSKSSYARTPPIRGTADLLDAYASTPWIHAVTSRIAGEVAGTGWRMYRKPSAADFRIKGVSYAEDEYKLVEVETHPLLDLLYNPNPVMDGYHLMYLTQVYLDLVGDAFWILERQNGIPVEAYPVPPHWVMKTPTPDDPTFEIRHNLFNGKVPETEIVWFKNPNPKDPYGRGRSPGWSLAHEIDTDEQAAIHTAARFYNSAVPELLVGVEGARKEQLEQAKMHWETKLQGARKAFQTHWHSGKLSVHQLSPTFQELQLIQLRQFERDTVVQIFGVPPEILGIIENANRSTIDAADYIFTKRVLWPRLKRIKAKLQQDLLPQFPGSMNLMLGCDSPVPEDKDYILSVAREVPQTRTINEWRDLQNLPPVEGGDEFYVPITYSSAAGGGEDEDETAEAEEEAQETTEEEDE